jgi:hypothetical protein
MIENTPAVAEGMSAISLAVTGTGDGTSPQEVIAVLIPIVAIVFGISIGMLSMYLDYRKKREIFELHHKERMAAIEKGMDVPPLPAELFERSRPGRGLRTRADYLRKGLVWLLVGSAITVALYNSERHESLWGLVPAAVGLAYLIFYFVDGRSSTSRPDER